MDETGFEERELVAYLPALHAFSRRFVRADCDAEDLVQETVSRALANMHLFRRGTRLKSWLFTIMRNTFLNEVHKTRREQPGSQECVSDRRSTDPSQEWAVRLREVETAMMTLSPDFLSAVMAAYAGESCEETATASGCAVGTVKSRTSRARHQILVEMGEAEPKDKGAV
jgi:RNA polymerase sigma factor (sigma-70 family)